MAEWPPFGSCFCRDRRLRLGAWSERDQEWLQVAENLYENYRSGPQGEPCAPEIPRKIHQIWLGGEMPEVFQIWLKEWTEKHCEWECKLWTEQDIDFESLENKDAFMHALDLGRKSDILRYEILYREGGFYIDADFECISSLDCITKQFSFVAGISNTGVIELNNGLIGCVPGHAIMYECIQGIKKNWATKARQESAMSLVMKFMSPDSLSSTIQDPIETITLTGPGMFTKVVFGHIDQAQGECNDIMLYPPTFFYPLPNNERDLALNERYSFLRPESVAVHHWACTWNENKRIPSLNT